MALEPQAMVENPAKGRRDFTSFFNHKVSNKLLILHISIICPLSSDYHSNIAEAISKIVDCVQGQGVTRIESGAYTLVREHFNSRDNAATGRKMHF